MSGMTAEEISMKLDKARLVFHRTVQDLAYHVRKLMLPIFKKRKWTFIGGNGTWYVSDDSNQDIRDSDLPKHIYDLLYMSVDGSNNLLGCWVDNIIEKDIA